MSICEQRWGQKDAFLQRSHKVSIYLLAVGALSTIAARGAIAQLGERLHGMQEVGGSIPPGSTSSDVDSTAPFVPVGGYG